MPFQLANVPPSVDDRVIPGHWKGDLILRSNDSYIATLVDRKTRFVMLAKVSNKTTNGLLRQYFPKRN